MAIRTESGLTKAFTGVNSLLNTTTQAATIADKLMRDKADSDFCYQQADFNRKYQEEMNKLQTSGDYGNWMANTESWLNDQEKSMLAECKNNYQAEKVKQFMANSRNTVKANVEQMVMRMEFDDAKARYDSTVSMNLQTYTGQDALEANKTPLALEVSAGLIMHSEYRAKTVNQAKSAIEADIYGAGKEKLDEFFYNGGTLSDLLSFVDDWSINSEYNVQLLDQSYCNQEMVQKALETGEGFIDVSGDIDKKAIASETKKMLESQWNAKEKEEQQRTFKVLSKMNGECIALADKPTEQLQYARNAINIINQIPLNSIDPDDRTKALNFFKSYTNGENSTGTDGKLSKDQMNYLMNNFDLYMKYVQDGTLNAYDAFRELKAVCIEDLETILGKEKGTLTEYDLMVHYPKAFTFLDAVTDIFPPEVKAKMKDYKQLAAKQVKEHKGDNAEEIAAGAVDLLEDMLFASYLNDARSIQEAMDSVENSINQLYAKELDYWRKNPETNKFELAEGLNLEKSVAKSVYGLQQHPEFIYSDRNGNVKPSIFTDYESMDTSKEMQLKYLSEEVGIDPATLEMVYEEDGVHDKKATMIFKQYGGAVQWKITSPDGEHAEIYTKRSYVDKDGKAHDGVWGKVSNKREVAENEQKTKARNVTEEMNEAKSLSKNLDLNKVLPDYVKYKRMRNTDSEIKFQIVNAMIQDYLKHPVEGELKDALKELGYPV